MTMWEKIIVNVEKGARKTVAGAAVFSERVKAEIAILRLRIRRNELRSQIDEQYRIIGRKVFELSEAETLPRTTEQLLKEEDIHAAVSEIKARGKDIEDMNEDIAAEKAAFKAVEKDAEESVP